MPRNVLSILAVFTLVVVAWLAERQALAPLLASDAHRPAPVYVVPGGLRPASGLELAADLAGGCEADHAGRIFRGAEFRLDSKGQRPEPRLMLEPADDFAPTDEAWGFRRSGTGVRQTDEI